MGCQRFAGIAHSRNGLILTPSEPGALAEDAPDSGRRSQSRPFRSGDLFDLIGRSQTSRRMHEHPSGIGHTVVATHQCPGRIDEKGQGEESRPGLDCLKDF